MDPEDITRHLIEVHPQLGVRSWSYTGTDREPRFSGTRDDGTSVVVDIRFTRYENANRFRAFLAISKGMAMTVRLPRPKGFVFFVLMIGRLPDHRPWWTALWDLDVVLAHWEALEPMSDGKWYRLDPRAIPVPQRPKVYDFLQVGIWDYPTEEISEDILMGALLAFESEIPKISSDRLGAVDAVMLRIRRGIRSEGERRT